MAIHLYSVLQRHEMNVNAFKKKSATFLHDNFKNARTHYHQTISPSHFKVKTTSDDNKFFLHNLINYEYFEMPTIDLKFFYKSKLNDLVKKFLDQVLEILLKMLNLFIIYRFPLAI